MNSLRRDDALYGLLFVLPVVLGFALFVIGPMITAIGYSFTDWRFIGPARSFIGMGNYVRLFTSDPLFRQVIGNSAYFTIGMVPLNVILALALAEALKTKIRGISFYRTAIFTPVVTTAVVWAILWRFIFATNGGLVNLVLRRFGFEGPSWLFDRALTMPTVIFVSAIKNVGINMTILLAALLNVPKMYYEAAVVEGAGPIRRYISVTLPLISPTLFMVVVVTVVGSLRVFSLIYAMTRGGPTNTTKVWVYYIYESAFLHLEIGYASAMAVLLFIATLILTLVQWAVRKRWVVYEK